MYTENTGGLHRLMVHPEERSEQVSFLFNYDTKGHLRKVHVHSSFSNQSLFSYLSADL